MYSANLNVEALNKANNALSIIEQLELIANQLTALEEHITDEFLAEVSAVAARAKGLLKIINDSSSEDVLALVDAAPITSLGKSKIDRLGIGSEIIRLREEQKMSYKDIATKFQISAPTVASYCNLYDKSKPLEKAKVRNTSIMDYVSTWEDMGAMIYRMLAKVESDPENHVKYISELRQLSVVVEKFQTKQTAQQQVEQIIQINKEILLDVLPEKRELIYERFQQVGLGRALQPQGLALR